MFLVVYWNQLVCLSIHVSACVQNTMYYFLSKRWQGYKVTFSDSSSTLSAMAIDLDQAKNLTFGKELIPLICFVSTKVVETLFLL